MKSKKGSEKGKPAVKDLRPRNTKAVKGGSDVTAKYDQTLSGIAQNVKA